MKIYFIIFHGFWIVHGHHDDWMKCTEIVSGNVSLTVALAQIPFVTMPAVVNWVKKAYKSTPTMSVGIIDVASYWYDIS